MRRSRAKSLLHQAHCLELEEPLDALFHPEAFKPLQEVSMAIGSLAQEQFSAPSPELTRKVLLKKIIQIRWMQK